MNWALFVTQLSLQIEAGKREQAVRDAAKQVIHERNKRIGEARSKTMAARREARSAAG